MLSNVQSKRIHSIFMTYVCSCVYILGRLGALLLFSLCGVRYVVVLLASSFVLSLTISLMLFIIVLLSFLRVL